VVRSCVAKRNITFDMDGDKFASTPKDDWEGRCNNLQIIEDQYTNNEGKENYTYAS
jgi:hypothetical protein